MTTDPLGVKWCAACEVGADTDTCPECGEGMESRHPGGMGALGNDIRP